HADPAREDGARSTRRGARSAGRRGDGGDARRRAPPVHRKAVRGEPGTGPPPLFRKPKLQGNRRERPLDGGRPLCRLQSHSQGAVGLRESPAGGPEGMTRKEEHLRKAMLHYLDGSIHPEELEVLNRVVETDPEARRELAELMLQD